MSSSGLRLSVIVPCFNYGHLLGRALDSVLGQLDDACELIIVDDGSTDQTPQLLAAIAAREIPGVRWLRQPNAGAAAARNTGFRASRGSHILFLDADDELLPGALATICAGFMEDPSATVLIGARVSRWPDGREKRHAPPRHVAEDPCRRVADHLLDKTLPLSHGAVAVARHLAEGRPYPETFRGREDIPVFANWVAYGHIKCIDVALVRIHKHPDSLRHTVRPDESGERALAMEIFSGLPPECRRLERAWMAQRYLALSRMALHSGEMVDARRFMKAALRTDPWRLLSFRNLRKTIKAWIGLHRR